jgi:hypothetical protein
MIVTSIRSVRHLYRVSDASFKTILVKFKENAWDICKVVKLPNDSTFGETLFVFNNYIRQSHWSFDTIAGSKEFRDFLRNEGGNYGRVITTTKGECASHDGFFQEITLLPDNFDKEYEKFLRENNKMISNLSAKYGLNTRDVRAKRMYIYTEGSKNFFQWAATVYYQNGTSLATIKNILTWNESYKQLAKNLSKGTITAYTSRDAIALLSKEMVELRKEKRINDSINMFNTAQKKLLREMELTEDDKKVFSAFYRLSESKKINFVKKMSTITDTKEIQISLVYS